MRSEPVEARVDNDSDGLRLDKFLVAIVPDLSRSAVQRAIKSGGATVNGSAVRASHLLHEGDLIVFEVPAREESTLLPEDIPLDILYEDNDLAVINKPAGLIVHPAPGHRSGTMANALLYHFQKLSRVNEPDRPGIVHRLDADTTGVILVAKNDFAHAALAAQFEARTVSKTYMAIVEGEVRFDADRIDLPLGPHVKDRRRQAVRVRDGKPAQTEYKVHERFGRFTYLSLHPRTGRTHQIRVHAAAKGFPVLCDPAYGRRARITASELAGQQPTPDEPPVLTRHALHAASIAITHPRSGQEVSFHAELPEDLAQALEILRHDDRPVS